MAHHTLPFWLLIGMLAVLLLAGRLISGLIRWAIRRATPATRRIAIRTGDALVRRRPGLDAVGRRFPRPRAWVARRFATDRFTGLPLTLIVVAAGTLVALGGDLAEDVIQRERIVQFDARVNAALAPLRHPDLLHVFAAITHLADVTTLVAVVLVVTAFLWAYRRPTYIPGLLLTVLGSQTLTYAGKYAIDRPRPEFLTFASAVTPSFPSGHATGAMAIYGFIAYAIARNMASARLRFELAYGCGALILLIAFSRLLLSVHFASDVAAGLLVGGFWLLAGFALTEYLNDRAARR
ncbi:phosphatase PAP2 family protein [Salinisphaera sp. RV14]|uniref:phosphatase PAP2 family protein n=1 Tax=unclassified Salinisphaera TaxID=2649847 RepID=UPI003F862936